MARRDAAGTGDAASAVALVPSRAAAADDDAAVAAYGRRTHALRAVRADVRDSAVGLFLQSWSRISDRLSGRATASGAYRKECGAEAGAGGRAFLAEHGIG